MSVAPVTAAPTDSASCHRQMSGKLRNDDFRNLILQHSKKSSQDTPAYGEQYIQQKPTANAKERHRQRYIQILRRQNRREKQSNKQSSTQAKYRDRAAERRNNQPEFQEAAKEYDMQRHCSLEESKYLGGDEEHTHLVKGLDYVVLQKVRMNIEKNKKILSTKLDTPPPEHGNVQSTGSPQNHFLDSKSIIQTLTHGIHPHHIAFLSKLRRVESVVSRGSHFCGNTTLFYSNRMVYQFSLDPNTQALPLWIVHGNSSVELPKGVLAPPTRAVFNVLQGNRVTVSASADSHKTDLQSEPDAAPVDDLDEDIFQGVGGFNVEEALPLALTDQHDATTQSQMYHYFDAEPSLESSSAVIPTDPPKSTRDASPLISSERQSPARPLRLNAPARRPKEQFDGYTECYPSMIPHHHTTSGNTQKFNASSYSKNASQKSSSKVGTKNNKLNVASSRAVRRQIERQWVEIEGYIEAKKHRNLDAIEQDLSHKTSQAPTANTFPTVL